MHNQSNIKRVVFVQKFIPHYRLPLFELLKEKLEKRGVEFILIYGKPDKYYGSKIKMAYPKWGTLVSNTIIPIFGRYVYWQGAPFKARKNDVFIVEHAARLLDNYPLFLLEQINYIDLCYFGHGKNFQATHEWKLSKLLKKLLIRRVSKWFAYTSVSEETLVEQGVEPKKIICVNNTLSLDISIKESSIQRKPTQFIYIGGLYDDKRINFLLESCKIVAANHSDFILDVVGAGPEAEAVKAFATQHTWCTYHGPLYGQERETLLFQSSAILMPGAVGLIAIDSFHFATPIITTACGQHGPEIAYLQHKTNYLTLNTEGTPEEYANMVMRFLKNKELSELLRNNCRDCANTYSLENTADKFIEGIFANKT